MRKPNPSVIAATGRRGRRGRGPAGTAVVGGGPAVAGAAKVVGAAIPLAPGTAVGPAAAAVRLLTCTCSARANSPEVAKRSAGTGVSAR